MIDKINKFFASEGGSPKEISKRQFVRLGLIIFGVVAAIFLLISFIFVGSIFKLSGKDRKEKQKDTLNIELSNNGVDREKAWQSYFQDELEETNKKTENRVVNLENSLKEKEQEIDLRTKTEIEAMREQLTMVHQQMKELIEEQRRAEQEKAEKEPEPMKVNLGKNEFASEIDFNSPKDKKLYIPATSFVTGYLIGGISVSTSVNSQDNPKIVVVRLTNRGNLPKDFEVDLTKCRIQGSSYGDLSSERAQIRVEELVCETSDSYIETKIVGQAYGDDGINGIKGHIVDTSSRRVAQAAFGGVISGLSQTLKTPEQFAFTGAGAINTGKSSFGDRLKNNSMSGIGNVGEKLADYYLRQADSMSPVLEIPAGTKVDIVFTKGIYLGSQNVRQKIEKERN